MPSPTTAPFANARYSKTSPEGLTHSRYGSVPVVCKKGVLRPQIIDPTGKVILISVDTRSVGLLCGSNRSEKCLWSKNTPKRSCNKNYHQKSPAHTRTIITNYPIKNTRLGVRESGGYNELTKILND